MRNILACHPVTAVGEADPRCSAAFVLQVLTHSQVVASLVRLLGSMDPRVQRASSSVLRTLAFKDEAAKRAIIDCGAIEPLIRMLRSEVCLAEPVLVLR